jgi:hypothetical protein
MHSADITGDLEAPEFHIRQCVLSSAKATGFSSAAMASRKVSSLKRLPHAVYLYVLGEGGG